MFYTLENLFKETTMTQMPLISETDDIEETPLPLIVAQRWNFPLAHIQTEHGMVYAVQDWMRGLTGEQNIRNLWTKFKNSEAGKQLSTLIHQLPYKATNGKTYQLDYVNDKGLYLIAQYMRVKHDRPMLIEIRQFLASAGAFVDQLRLEPEMVFENVKDPDKLLDAFIAYHRKRGMSDSWIHMRIEGRIKRNQFTAALSEFVKDTLRRWHYSTATDDVYTGLWGRTAATLKSQLELSKKDNLRDHQPEVGLYYQGIVEAVCADSLEEREEVTWNEARDIIQTIAKIIGRQAEETSRLMKRDLATGKRLLPR
jgi:hypothetical protein